MNIVLVSLMLTLKIFLPNGKQKLAHSKRKRSHKKDPHMTFLHLFIKFQSVFVYRLLKDLPNSLTVTIMENGVQ